jgi:hypothetical protein
MVKARIVFCAGAFTEPPVGTESAGKIGKGRLPGKLKEWRSPSLNNYTGTTHNN